MSIKKMSKDELELLSHKDITNLLLEEKGMQNTADLFKKIIDLLGLPKKYFDEKIGDYFTSLATDKRFIMLDDGKWDLQSRHQSVKLSDIEEEEEELEEVETSENEEEKQEDYEVAIDDDDSFDDTEDDLSDLVVLDEDELELEQ